MKIRLITLGLFSSTVLLGCTIANAPMSAKEFRKVVKENPKHTKMEVYTVNVPYQTVLKNFKQLAPKCLDVTVKSSSYSPTQGVSNSYEYYKHTLIAGKSSAELHVQRLQPTDQVYIKQPEDGSYIVVADAANVGSNKTRITLSYANFFGEPVAKAINGWTHNKDLRCPDLRN